jgi:glycosyltransferase involved in cell wall biosynthesis
MQNPLISVIVPVYKVEQYLRTCLNSVLNQTYNNWELILVDDGSPDNCPQICDNYAKKDNRIKVIHKKNGGVSSARNLALDNSQGDYVAFLDSDDFWHSEYLKIMIDLCQEYEADIAQCSFIRGTEKVFPRIKSSKNFRIFDNHSIFLKGYAKIIVCAKLYKSYLFEGVRMPVGKLFEDDFTTWKWYYKAKKIVVIDEALYYYTENEQSTMSGHAKLPSLDYIEAYEERIDFFKSNGVKELEDFSQGHLCKALLLTSNNKKLTSTQKNIVDATFLSNWQKIKHSKNVMLPLRILFFMFRFSPKTTLRLLNTVR